MVNQLEEETQPLQPPPCDPVRVIAAAGKPIVLPKERKQLADLTEQEQAIRNIADDFADQSYPTRVRAFREKFIETPSRELAEQYLEMLSHNLGQVNEGMRNVRRAVKLALSRFYRTQVAKAGAGILERSIVAIDEHIASAVNSEQTNAEKLNIQFREGPTITTLRGIRADLEKALASAKEGSLEQPPAFFLAFDASSTPAAAA